MACCSPPAFHNRPSRGLRPRAPLRPSPPPSCGACPGRAAPRSTLLWAARPRRAGCAARAVGTAWPPAGDAGGPGRCAPERPAQTCRVHFLSALGGRQPTIIHHDRRAFLPQLLEVCGALPSLGPLGRCCTRPGAHRQHPRHPLPPQCGLAGELAPLLLPGGSGVLPQRAFPQRLGKTTAPVPRTPAAGVCGVHCVRGEQRRRAAPRAKPRARPAPAGRDWRVIMCTRIGLLIHICRRPGGGA
jgi:hypothetical protein